MTKRMQACRGAALGALIATLFTACTNGDSDDHPRASPTPKPISLERYLHRPCELVPPDLPTEVPLRKPTKVSIDRENESASCGPVGPEGDADAARFTVRLRMNAPESWMDPHRAGTHDMRWRLGSYVVLVDRAHVTDDDGIECWAEAIVPPNQLLRIVVTMDLNVDEQTCVFPLLEQITRGVIDRVSAG